MPYSLVNLDTYINVNMAQVIKATSVAITLLKTKEDLENLLRLIRDWRTKGINGTGIVPISILPLEAKLEKSIIDIDSMIKIAVKI